MSSKPSEKPTRISQRKLDSLLGDLIRAPEAWMPFHIANVAKAAKREINRLRKQLRATS
jgi:hypothetical protein